jgi:KRAB domain-containing zinc finger protein
MYSEMLFQIRISFKFFVTHTTCILFSFLSLHTWNWHRHEKIHTSEHLSKSFICSICQMGFCQIEVLKKHENIHSDDKPFFCTVCSRGFRTNEDFETHKIVHTGSKPYKCLVCQKGFRINLHLQIHQRIHTGEKPFVLYYK